MNVICDRCSTEYDFEEALVSPRGTAVKCTHCGNLFKLYHTTREHAGVDVPVAAAAQPTWTVRRTDGSSHELSMLAEITRLIGDGKFTRDDEVSRTGKVWRRLGNVEELEPYFVDADRRGPSRARDAAPLASVLAISPAAAVRVMRGRTAGEEETSAQPPDLPARERRITNPQGLRLGADPAAPAKPAWPFAKNRGADAPAGRPAPQPSAALRITHSPEPVSYPVRDSALELGSPRARRGWPWFVACGCGVIALYVWNAPPSTAPHTPLRQQVADDPSAQFIERGDRALSGHRAESFVEALTEYSKALAFHADEPRILSAVSRVHALWAQELLFAADASSGLGERTETSSLEPWLRVQADQARHYAGLALRAQPGNAEAGIALSDALRLTGDVAAARAEYSRISASAFATSSAESLRVAALLAASEARDLRAGRELASQAVARDPNLIRARLLLARCLIAAGDLSAAQEQLREVAKRSPNHPALRALDELQKRSAEPPMKVAAASEASAPQVDSSSHESYIARGQSALEAGQVSVARRLFEQALYLRPTSTQAHAGLGYVALERNRPSLAVEHFSAAMRGGNDDALIGLGEAYRRLGRNREALRVYQSYLNRKPKGSDDNLSVARAQVNRLSAELSGSDKTP